MQFSLLDFALILLAVLPGSLLAVTFGKKQHKFSKLEKLFNMRGVNDINKIIAKPGFCIIHIDKIYMDNNLIDIGIQLPIAENIQVNQINVNQHYKFYHSYLDKRWDMAIVIANSMKTAWNGEMKQYYEYMIARCNFYKLNPPPTGWSGIYHKI